MWEGVAIDSIPVRKEKDGVGINPYLAKNTPISGDIVEGTWLHMTSPRVGWVNAGVGMTKVRWKYVTVTPPPPPPPNPTKTVTNIIKVYSDGSIDVTPQ